ncbi:MAG: hypothetical protein ACXVZU_01515, partial [Methanobacteriaceae archaeon]
ENIRIQNLRILCSLSKLFKELIESEEIEMVKDEVEELREIINELEDVGFIQKDTVSVSQSEGTLSLSMIKCRADACKQLINNGIIPKVCMRSIVLANFLESLTGEEFTYMLEADPQSGSCTSYLGETVE